MKQNRFRCSLQIFIMGIFLILISSVSWAGLVGSAHDMEHMFANIYKQPLQTPSLNIRSPFSGPCSHCHIPHRAMGPKLWPTNLSKDTNTLWGVSIVTSMCEHCHVGDTYYNRAAGTSPAGVGYVRLEHPFGLGDTDTLKRAHGRNVGILTSGAWPTSPSPIGDVNPIPPEVHLANFNYQDGDPNLKCTSCHAVHDNTFRPFLETYGDPGTYQNGHFLQYCLKCHAKRANGVNNNSALGRLNKNPDGFGNHPTGMALVDTPGVNGLPNANILNPLRAVTPPFPVCDNPTGPAAIGIGLWNTGIHFDVDSTGTKNLVTCATCHLVHGDDNGIPDTNAIFKDQSGRLLFTQYVGGETGVISTAPPVASPSNSVNNNVCLACHNSLPNYIPSLAWSGPGAANTNSHPIFRTPDAWDGKTRNFIEKVSPTGQIQTVIDTIWYQHEGTNKFICTSCHDIHWSRKAEYCLHRACNECHSHNMIKHHPSSQDSSWPELRGKVYTVGTHLQIDTDLAQEIGLGANYFRLFTGVSSQTTPNGNITYTIDPNDPGNQVSGQMLCETCHSGGNTNSNGLLTPTVACQSATFNSQGGCIGCHGTGHNCFKRKGKIETNRNSEWCLICHSVTPSKYTESHGMGSAAEPGHIGTHYCYAIEHSRSNVLCSGDIATLAYQQTLCYKRPDCVPSGDDNCTICSKWGDNGHRIVCESCHTVLPGNFDSINTGPTAKPRVRLLLAPTGDTHRDFATDLCVLCHTCNPGSETGGHTHPVCTTPITGKITLNSPLIGEATLPSKTNVNCCSCHRAHDAFTGGGSAIVKWAEPDPALYTSTVPNGGNRRLFELCSTTPGKMSVNAGNKYTGIATLDASYGNCSMCHTQYREK